MRKNKEITEEQLLKTLDIPDWRYMSKDKLITFASNMAYLDPVVAQKALEQFPEFKSMSQELVSILKSSLDSANNSADKSIEKAYELNAKILDSLDRRLNRRFLLPGERKQIIDAMLEVSDNIKEMDKEHKTFLNKGVKVVGAVGLGITTLAATALGVVIHKD